VISHTVWRNGFRGPEPRRPSPYLDDVPREVLEVRGTATTRAHAPRALGPGADDEPTFVRERGLDLEVGDRVVHRLLGEGRLTALRGTGPETRLVVDFDSGSRRELLLPYANLRRLP
jgi:hypothetical protein